MMYATGEQRAVLEVALRNATGHLGAVERKVKDLQVAHEIEIRASGSQSSRDC
jgi:hypothetical protein